MATREYQRKYMKRRRQEDPEFKKRTDAYGNDWKRRNTKGVRDLITKFKARGCALCPEKEPCCMHAHHLRDKDFMISTAIRRRLSVKRVEAELKKCICVCGNCHSKVHAGKLTIPAQFSA